MAGQRLDTLPPNQRAVNTVFQNYALFPHLSVFENVAYGLRAKKLPERGGPSTRRTGTCASKDEQL